MNAPVQQRADKSGVTVAVVTAAFFGFWIILILAFAAQLVFRASFPWEQAIRSSLVDWLPWVLLSPLVWWLAGKFPLERGRLQVSVPVQIFVCAVVVTACGWMTDVMRPPLPGAAGFGAGRELGGGDGRGEERRFGREGPPPGPTMREGGPPIPGPGRGGGRRGAERRFLNAVVLNRSRINLPVYWLTVSFAHAVAFYRRVQERDRRALELNASLSQAKLHALRLQMQPHFLFNTLNAISTLVHRDAEAADEMIANLSEMLRLSLEVTEQEVPLRHELDLLDRYLAIERVRLGERLRIERAVEPAALGALVPPMLLQTIVENAIRHGIEPRRAPGTVLIQASRAGDVLNLVVRDDGIGLRPAAPGTERRGVGLANTEARVRELYGPAGRVLLREAPAGGVSVEIDIPFRTEVPARPATIEGAP